MFFEQDFLMSDDVRSLPVGLFDPVGRRELGRALKVSDKHGDFIVYMTGQYAFAYASLKELRGTMPCLHWKGARVQVDFDTLFRPAREGHRRGSVVLRGDQMYVAAMPADSLHGDIELLPLGAEAVVSSEFDVGFTGWRFVIGEGAHQQILWEIS